MSHPFSLKKFQIQALEALETAHHVICISQTGSGKSLIYELFSNQKEIRLLLISPLVVLNEQHREALNKNSNQKYLVLSPESLKTPSGIKKINELNPNFLVIDECHCVWEWGESFRKDYEYVFKLFSKYSIQKSLWITATLTHDAVQKLRQFFLQQGIYAWAEIGKFSLPPNIHIQWVETPWQHRLEVLDHLVMTHLKNYSSFSGLIYVYSRKNSERVHAYLSARGVRSRFFHSKMSWEEKKILMKEFREQKIEVLIVTTAFGMGMHFSHLRWLVMFELPCSELEFAQLTGRVGRSGDPSFVFAMWEKGDFSQARFKAGLRKLNMQHVLRNPLNLFNNLI